MYEPDSLDRVDDLTGFPQPSVGAPLPFIVSNEDVLLLGYLVETVPENWDGTQTRIVAQTSPGEPIALLEFRRHYAHTFGPPNDEVFESHPLAARGLRRYTPAEVRDSSWVRSLETLNSLHPNHDPGDFSSLRHFIIPFHDSIFECVAEDVEVTLHAGPVRDLWPDIREKLGWQG
jgi:hypothetical protein